MGYTKDTIKGISWIGLFRIVTRVISFLRTAVTARILNPSQFGVFSIATIVLSFLEILTETGINIFLIQKNETFEEYIDTAFIVSILRGIIISCAILLSAPFIAAFFNSPESLLSIQLIAIVPFLRGFINPSIARFLVDLTFHREFIYRTTVFGVESVATLLFAFLLRNPESLVYGLIVGASFEILFSFWYVNPRPKLNFHQEKFWEVVHQGKWLTLSGIFNYLYHNADNMVVGRMLGTGDLGLYQMAYRISTLPITEVSDTVTRVTFPVFVKLTDDKKRLWVGYIKSVGVIAILVIPASLVCYLFPEFVISILLGSQWTSAANALRVLAIFGVVRSITMAASSPILAQNRQDALMIITLVSFAGMIIPIVPLVSMYGIIGAGYAALIGSLMAIPVIGFYLFTIFKE